MALRLAQSSQIIDINKERRLNSDVYYNVRKYFARITQFISWPIFYIIFNTFFNLKIKGRENLDKISSPFILISNHISSYDSFVFRVALGFFTPNLPLRFMAVRKFNSLFLNILSFLGIIDLIYFIFGVFVIVEGRGIDKNLKEAQEIIKNGGNVVMYPEGGIVKGQKIGQFKLGASVLTQKTGADVLPVSMKFTKRKFLRRGLIVNIGRPIDYERDISSVDLTKVFHRRIEALYEEF